MTVVVSQWLNWVLLGVCGFDVASPYKRFGCLFSVSNLSLSSLFGSNQIILCATFVRDSIGIQIQL